jgi:hypothetical protein
MPDALEVEQIAMEGRTSKISPIKRFFLVCSGSDLGILSRPECSIELNKHLGIGATILSTALLASLSGGYALYTVFNPIATGGTQSSLTGYLLPIGFGLLWGAIIFNLDRYIVSTIRKQAVSANLSFRHWLRWKFGEFARVLPRLLLAIFISIIITRPIELRMFETEIRKEMLRQTSNELADMTARMDREFPDIERLTRENQTLQQQTDAKRRQVNELYELALAEGMGEQRNNTTGRVGKGPFYRERMDAYVRAQQELDQLIQANSSRVAANDAILSELRRQKAIAEANRQPTIAQNGLVAQLNTLNDLSERNRPIKLASWFLILLFMMLETAPIIVKVLSDRGPYDDIYETLEHSVTVNEQKKSFELDSQIDTDMAFTELLHADILAAKLKLSRQMVDSLESLAASEIMAAQTEVSRLIVEQWKRAQKNNLKARTLSGFQNGNSSASNFGSATANETLKTQ